ncbi:MAG: hypothetical protein E7D27_15125 [Clostridium celatum]|jgi:hypothetical protein|nr:hypothetical protein [Clostridium celatum]
MTLNEILLKENEGKKFLCRDNSFIVRNDCGTLLYLNKTFDDGTQHWKNCIISKVWVNANYEIIG